jgi:small subunit ribosomal protein S20
LIFADLNRIIPTTMPITKSAQKALRQTRTRTSENTSYERAMRGAIKSFERAVEAKDYPKASALLPAAQKTIDKAAKRGILHKNTAARKKSRLVFFARRILNSK